MATKKKIPYARKRPARNRFEAWLFSKYGTQKNLADALGISYQSINNWMEGRNVPNSVMMKKIWELSRDEITPNYWHFELPTEIREYRMIVDLHEPSDA